MEPIGWFVRPRGESALVHACRRCGIHRYNRVASDDIDSAIEVLPRLDPAQFGLTPRVGVPTASARSA
jgi:hypothetical protein